jgi:predicted CoA-binding protein
MAKATNRTVQQIEQPIDLIDIFKHLEDRCQDLIKYIQ